MRKNFGTFGSWKTFPQVWKGCLTETAALTPFHLKCCQFSDREAGSRSWPSAAVHGAFACGTAAQADQYRVFREFVKEWGAPVGSGAKRVRVSLVLLLLLAINY